MFYLKTELNGKQVEIEIYSDEIYTRCFNCGNEFQVDPDLLQMVLESGGDFSSSVSCCTNKRPELKRVK